MMEASQDLSEQMVSYRLLSAGSSVCRWLGELVYLALATQVRGMAYNMDTNVCARAPSNSQQMRVSILTIWQQSELMGLQLK